MLVLPDDWRSFHKGAVVVRLLGQISDHMLKNEAVRHLIGASLELAVAGIYRHERRPPVEEVSEFTWRIEDYTYAYFPDIDDAALAKAIELGSGSPCAALIVPPRHSEVLLRACEPTPKSQTPMILSLDSFISLRTHFTSGDLGWTHNQVLIDLLRRYNRRAVGTSPNGATLVDIPLGVA